MTEPKIPNADYLSLIQNVISRMANNAFLIKGWSITLTTALFAVSISLQERMILFGMISFVPLIIFWWLDGYFFYNEKKYRDIYDYARKVDEFNEEHLFDLNPNLLTPALKGSCLKVTWLTVIIRFKVMFEKAVYPIYLMQILIIILIYNFNISGISKELFDWLLCK